MDELLVLQSHKFTLNMLRICTKQLNMISTKTVLSVDNPYLISEVDWFCQIVWSFLQVPGQRTCWYQEESGQQENQELLHTWSAMTPALEEPVQDISTEILWHQIIPWRNVGLIQISKKLRGCVWKNSISQFESILKIHKQGLVIKLSFCNYTLFIQAMASCTVKT